MSSRSDDKTKKPPTDDRKGKVVEDGRGHQIWEGTIKTIKLSLMKTGMFKQTEVHRRLQELAESDTEAADAAFDEEQEILGGGGGFDPYDSTKK